jgi:hypothetical protein
MSYPPCSHQSQTFEPISLGSAVELSKARMVRRTLPRYGYVSEQSSYRARITPFGPTIDSPLAARCSIGMLSRGVSQSD